MPSLFTKDPDEVLDYKIDWEDWLGTDTIIASTWVATTGLTIDSDSFTSTYSIVVLSGGTLNNKYFVTNHITTASGREDDRTITIICTNK